MPTYKQTVKFEREIHLTARDAAEANDKLQDLIRSSEFHGDVRVTDYDDFEDDPVECPTCKGAGDVGEEGNEVTCSQCNGEGTVPFKAS